VRVRRRPTLSRPRPAPRRAGFARSAACGNGALDGGEDCDLGSANGAVGSCCACDCTFLTAAATCREATGGCDAPETCSGTSASCPVDAGPYEAVAAQITIGKLFPPASDDLVKLDLTFPARISPFPFDDSVTVEIRRADTSAVLEVALPTGPTWRSSITSFRYGPGKGVGVNSATVHRDFHHERVRLKLKATGVLGAVAPGDLPLTVTVNPGYLDGAAGQCGPTAFPTLEGALSGSGKALKCRRK